MKTIPSLLTLVSFAWAVSCSPPKTPVALKKEILTESRKLNENMQALRQVVQSNTSQSHLAEHYRKTRLDYQKMEWALEYFLPEILDRENATVSQKAGDSFYPSKDFTALDALIASDTPKNQPLILEQIDVLIQQNNTITDYVGSIDLGETALTTQ